MTQTPLILSWREFNEAVAHIARIVAFWNPHPAAVFGIPRGGLPLAVGVSHHLGIPLQLHPNWHPNENVVVVDDVVETGATLDRYMYGNPLPPIVWCNKSKLNILSVTQVPADRWIVFPWESTEKAHADAAAYYASRQRGV